MASALGEIYNRARLWSRLGIALTIVVVAFLDFVSDGITISIQIAIALIALLIGVPHGAIDHLISLPSHPRSRFFLFIAAYIVIAVIAGWGIALWNVAGFQSVLIMSGLHFGFGDASFLNERQDARKGARHSSISSGLYAIPAGFLPILLPLTDDRTTSALQRINPAIVDWSGNQSHSLRSSLFVLAWISITVLILVRKYGMVVDLVLLSALALVAPPLIAFASYFGLWHAVRHTARLVPKLPTAMERADSGDLRGALARAVIPGLYAVVGTFLAALAVMVLFPGKFSSSLLWASLVIVWALTVPHMISTARFDLRALSK
jgi:Brp/Blh family beta-carotene 15,15'-monooxygenase